MMGYTAGAKPSPENDLLLKNPEQASSRSPISAERTGFSREVYSPLTSSYQAQQGGTAMISSLLSTSSLQPPISKNVVYDTWDPIQSNAREVVANPNQARDEGNVPPYRQEGDLRPDTNRVDSMPRIDSTMSSEFPTDRKILSTEQFVSKYSSSPQVDLNTNQNQISQKPLNPANDYQENQQLQVLRREYARQLSQNSQVSQYSLDDYPQAQLANNFQTQYSISPQQDRSAANIGPGTQSGQAQQTYNMRDVKDNQAYTRQFSDVGEGVQTAYNAISQPTSTRFNQFNSYEVSSVLPTIQSDLSSGLPSSTSDILATDYRQRDNFKLPNRIGGIGEREPLTTYDQGAYDNVARERFDDVAANRTYLKSRSVPLDRNNARRQLSNNGFVSRTTSEPRFPYTQPYPNPVDVRVSDYERDLLKTSPTQRQREQMMGAYRSDSAIDYGRLNQRIPPQPPARDQNQYYYNQNPTDSRERDFFDSGSKGVIQRQLSDQNMYARDKPLGDDGRRFHEPTRRYLRRATGELSRMYECPERFCDLRYEAWRSLQHHLAVKHKLKRKKADYPQFRNIPTQGRR